MTRFNLSKKQNALPLLPSFFSIFLCLLKRSLPVYIAAKLMSLIDPKILDASIASRARLSPSRALVFCTATAYLFD